MSQYPLGFGQWLQALAYALSKPREIAIAGDPDLAETQALLHIVRESYRPFQVVALGAPDAHPSTILFPKARGLVNGHAAAYGCRTSTCQAPVTEAKALQGLLEQT